MENKTPSSEFAKDITITELAKKPEIFCQHFNIPITIIKDVRLIEHGKTKSFEYLGKTHKYVESIAREYYESLGLEVSWNEGIAVQFVEHACERALMKRIFRNFKIHSYESYTKQNSLLTPNSDLESRILKKIEDAKLDFDRNDQWAHQRIREVVISLFSQLEWINSSLVTTREDPEFTRRLVIDEYEKLIAQPPPIDEIKIYIIEYMESQKEKYSAPHLKFNLIKYNDWTLNFSLRLVEILGIKPFAHDPRNKNQLPMRVSDLTVLDVKNKELRFVEVKNKDGFTQNQVFSLQQWLSTPASNRESFELCLVQPSP